MTGSIVTKFAPVMLQVRFNAELREERQKLFSERDSRRADLKNLEEKLVFITCICFFHFINITVSVSV